MANVKGNSNIVRSKIEAIKKFNDNPQTGIDDFVSSIKDDLPSMNGILRRRIDDYKDKGKSKKTQRNDIFDNLINTVESFLGSDGTITTDTTQKPRVKNKLRKYSQESARITLQASKQIVMNTVRNNLFSGEGVCGSNNPMPESDLDISPKEFDLLNMLKVSPDSPTGSIMYEPKEDRGFIKMNRIFYEQFNSTQPYSFKNNENDTLFELYWSSAIQKYSLSGLKGPYGITNVNEFLTDYYSSIEYPDFETIIKQAILMTIQGDGTESKSFNIGMDRLERLLQKLFSICGNTKKTKPLDQNPIEEINENDEDIEAYFDFNDVDGIDLDEEDSRHRRVLKFVDCNNFEIPTNKNHIEDFVHFIEKKKNLDDNVTDTLNKIALEAYEESARTISMEALQISLAAMFILKLPKALISAILSPKMVFPIVVVYKIFKGVDVDVTEIMKIMSKLFFEIIKKVFWKFIREFWKFVKKDLLNFIKKVAIQIIKNKLKRWKAILTALISLLKKLLNMEIGSCESIFNAILMAIELALSKKINIPIPGFLLGLSDNLPGYSTDRAYINIVERMSASGIPMEPLFGRPNKLNSMVKSIIDGNTQEMDANGYTKVANQEIYIPTPVGPIVIPPGLLISNGKNF